MNIRTLFLSTLLVFATACKSAGDTDPKNDPRLKAAEAALEKAAQSPARDCAKETFEAAEAALVEARRLFAEGDSDAGAQKAAEAASLFEKAEAASPPGCDQPAPEPEPQPSQTTEAGMTTSMPQLHQTVYFDFNASTIQDASKGILSEVAGILSKNRALKIVVEGHCDTRGSTEYNLHLGERRAQSVERYLITQGVLQDQLSVISYGEERPVDTSDTEVAHQRNRRAEIVAQ